MILWKNIADEATKSAEVVFEYCRRGLSILPAIISHGRYFVKLQGRRGDFETYLNSNYEKVATRSHVATKLTHERFLVNLTMTAETIYFWLLKLLHLRGCSEAYFEVGGCHLTNYVEKHPKQ